MENNTILIRKVDVDEEYNPARGWLLFDVSVKKNVKLNSLTLTGKKSKIFLPPRNLLFAGLSIVSDTELDSIKDLRDKDVLIRIGKKAIIKRQYYYLKEVELVNRCFFDVPMIILNCLKEEEIPKESESKKTVLLED